MNNGFKHIHPVASLTLAAANVLLTILCLGCGMKPQPSSQQPKSDPVAPTAAAPAPTTSPVVTAPAKSHATPAPKSASTPNLEESIKKFQDDKSSIKNLQDAALGKGKTAAQRITEASGPTSESLSRLKEEVAVAADARRNPKFRVRYRFSTEADLDDIEVRNLELTYTDLGPIDLAARQAESDPRESRPLYGQEDLIRFQGTLSGPQVDDLAKLLEDVKFLKLDEAYGGPGPGGRSYDEVFEVTLKGQQKKVVYHHHPTAKPMPEELVKLRTELFRLVDQKFRQNHKKGSTP